MLDPPREGGIEADSGPGRGGNARAGWVDILDNDLGDDYTEREKNDEDKQYEGLVGLDVPYAGGERLLPAIFNNGGGLF